MASVQWRIMGWFTGAGRAPARHAEAGGGEDLALDLVHASAERVDLRRPAGAFEVAVQDRTGRALGQVAGGADDTEERAVHVDERLGAVDLRSGRVGGCE